jgi:hypothetical protein
MAARRRVAEQHEDWLNLTDPEAPWFSLPVLKRVLPNGLDPAPSEIRAEHKARWFGDENEASARLAEDRTDYIGWLLRDALGWRDDYLTGSDLPDDLASGVTRHDVTITPSGAYRPAAHAPVGLFDDPADSQIGDAVAVNSVLVFVLPAGRDPRARPPGDTWPATWVQRAALSCRHHHVPLALVTDGDHLTLVHAPEGGATGWGTWRASEFSTEPILLASFRSMLDSHRFTGVVDSDTPEALLLESVGSQAEVTDQLGTQVRRATELLVNAISRANLDRSGALLDGVGPHEVYEAAVTVMMRTVFLLVAEENDLLPVDNLHYQDLYAVRTLRESLQNERFENPEVLETRTTAWHRLLATSRAVHSGVHHDELSVPAYGGNLFDPDRFPFLEGRTSEGTWHTSTGTPIPITDLDVLAILDALLVLRFSGSGGVTDTRRLSYRHVDVEQIGHIYERLLDHDAVEADTVVLGLRGKVGEEPEVALPDLEAKRIDGGHDAVVAWLSNKDADKAGRTVGTRKQVEKLLAAPLEPHLRASLIQACQGDMSLAARIEPFANLLRLDLRDRPLVFLESAVYVTETGSRRDSGTAYTTKELADEVAEHALAPLCYSPGPQDTADTNEWRIRRSAEILDLKVCDPAVGSGAILVAACRYLAERLIEAWRAEGDTRSTETATAADDPNRLDVVVDARRLVAEHCCYGVDRNPMAVEMAKLSMWLTTVAKDRPFTFLDHALKSGDSLLGIWDFEQLRNLHYDTEFGRSREASIPGFSPDGDARVAVEKLLEEALQARQEMSEIRTVRPADVERKLELHTLGESRLAILSLVADVLAGAALSTASVNGGNKAQSERVSLDADVIVPLLRSLDSPDFDVKAADAARRASLRLDAGKPPKAPSRRPLHWPIAFPEAFSIERQGFDVIVGNPPYLGGTKISGPMGSDFRRFLAAVVAGRKTDRADLVTFFLLLASRLTARTGVVGLLTTQAISQGESRTVGLDSLLHDGWEIVRVDPRRRWPNTEAVYVALIWMSRIPWKARKEVAGVLVDRVSSGLRAEALGSDWTAKPLASRVGRALQGAKPASKGFVLSAEEGLALRAECPELKPVVLEYLTGSDFNSTPDQSGRRFAVYFADWERQRAQSFPEAFEIVSERVPPTRRKSKAHLQERFWQFEHPAVEALRRIEPYDRWIGIAETSKTLTPAFVRSGVLPSNSMVVIPSDDFFDLGLLTSSLHYYWVLRHTTYMKTDPRYVPARVFDTFPFPAERSREVARVMDALSAHRAKMLQSRSCGLTTIYTSYHRDGPSAPEDMLSLRELHQELDFRVMNAYGWDDLELQYGFRDVDEQGQRWTVTGEHAEELVHRLLELNREQFAAAGSTENGETRRSRTPKRLADRNQASLLEEN